MKSIQPVGSGNSFNEIVLNQLNKILAHPLFVSSDILSKFLSFIVHEALAGRQDQIKEYTIAILVLNKPAGFSPPLNGIVRVHAKRLRDALNAYYNQKEFQYDCLIAIPKGRYVPLIECKGSTGSPATAEKSSVYDLCESKANRIAFLPFKVYNRNLSCASFVDNLAEELTRQFSELSALSVLSYHSTRTLFPGKCQIKKLVSSYNVQYVISGSIRFEHSKIKVFAELIDTASENQIWSGVYYHMAGAADYFRTVDQIAFELMTDLIKIKNLACNANLPLTRQSEDPKRGRTVMPPEDFFTSKQLASNMVLHQAFQ